MTPESRAEAIETAKLVFQLRKRLLFGPRFSEDIKHEKTLVPPSKAREKTLQRAYEWRKESPAEYDLLVAYGAECLQRSVLPPHWLAQFLASHLRGEEVRPKVKGPNKKNLKGRDLALAMAVREVRIEYEIPVKTNEGDSDTAVSIVCDAVKCLKVFVSESTVYNAYRKLHHDNKNKLGQ